MSISIRCQLGFSSISVSVVCVCLSLSLSNDLLSSLSINVSKDLLSLCLILSLIIVYLFSNLLYERTNVNFTYQMLAELLSLYQLVLCTSNVYVRPRESISQFLAGLLLISSISVSVVCVCLSLSLSNDLLSSLSINVSKDLLSLCLILSLIIVYLFSNLLYERTNVNFTVNASFYYVTSTSNILGLCCGGIQQTDNGIIIQIIIVTLYILMYSQIIYTCKYTLIHTNLWISIKQSTSSHYQGFWCGRQCWEKPTKEPNTLTHIFKEPPIYRMNWKSLKRDIYIYIYIVLQHTALHSYMNMDETL